MAKTKNPDQPEPNKIEVVSLMDHLSTPIAKVNVPPVIDGETQPEPDYSGIQLDDEPEPAPQPAQRPEPAYQSYEQINDHDPKTLSPDDVAIIAVNMFDGIQQFALALFSKTMMLTAEERQLIDTLDTSNKTIYADGSREAIAMQKYRKHIEMVKDLPFTDGEKQRLQDAGIIYARTLNVQVTPLQGIMMALAEVMGTRGSKIIMNSL